MKSILYIQFKETSISYYIDNSKDKSDHNESKTIIKDVWKTPVLVADWEEGTVQGV